MGLSGKSHFWEEFPKMEAAPNEGPLSKYSSVNFLTVPTQSAVPDHPAVSNHFTVTLTFFLAPLCA